MPGLCQYSKKVADEYPWTQAVFDVPHSVTPQMMPKKTKNFLFKALPSERIL